jgi:hypothetical protein
MTFNKEGTVLDGLKRKFAATALTSLLKSLATDKNTQTTITGLIAGAVLAVPGLDVGKLISGDGSQIAHLVAGLLVAALGFLATKENRDGHTTLIGTVAGSAYAMQGSVESITTGVVLALVGYLTNKPTAGTTGSDANPR